MKIKHAIEVLREDIISLYKTDICKAGDGTPDVELIEALYMGIQSLMKQDQKKPSFDTENNYVQGYKVEDTYVHCAVCGYRFYSIINGEECAGRKTPYCPMCGQKIDWEMKGENNENT